MQVVLNGKASEVADRASIEQLLAERGLIPSRVAVEVNEELVPRKQFSATQVQQGDRIEIVTFVGGG